MKGRSEIVPLEVGVDVLDEERLQRGNLRDARLSD